MTDASKFMKDFKEFINAPTDEELNKRIHEILGICWHNEISEIWQECLTCHKYGDDIEVRMDFTTSWAGFGILIEWWQKHEKFEVFFSKILFDGIASGKRTISQIVAELLSPLALTEATVKFFKEE